MRAPVRLRPEQMVEEGGHGGPGDHCSMQSPAVWKRGKEFGHALHFVQNHQPASVCEQEGFGVFCLALGGRQLQVKIDCAAVPVCFGKGESGLPRRARLQENDCRKFGEQVSELLLGKARLHWCNPVFLWKTEMPRMQLIRVRFLRPPCYATTYSAGGSSKMYWIWLSSRRSIDVAAKLVTSTSTTGFLFSSFPPT